MIPVAQGISFCFVMPWHIEEGRGGGAEVQAWYFAKALVQMKYQVSYVCQSVNGRRGIEQIDGIQVNWLTPSKKFQWLDVRKYYQALSQIHPDIVIQRMSAASGWAIAKYCREFQKEYVWICADDDATSKWMHVKKYRRYNKVRSIKNSIFFMNAIVNDLYRRAGMKGVSIAFAQHEEQVQQLQNNFRLAPKRIRSGHPLPVFDGKIQAQNKGKHICWVANLGPRKRPESFINLARLIQDEDFQCNMIGSRGDKNYVQHLLNQAPSNLHYLGKLTVEEVNYQLNRALILVNTSDDGGEGFPNTFVQAWLRGVPVVTLGINPDHTITEHALGYVCGTISDMAQKVRELYANEELYKRLSDNCLHYARENHAIDKVVDHFLNQLNSRS